MKAEEIIKAAKDDVWSFSPIPLPKNLIEYFAKILWRTYYKHNADRFINWTNRKWKDSYSNIDDDQFISLMLNESLKKLPYVVIFDNVINKYELPRFGFVYSNNLFQPDTSILNYTEEAYRELTKILSKQKKITSDSENLRLLSIKEHAGRVQLYVERVLYSTYIHTNLILDYKAKGKYSLRDIVNANKNLENLDNSKLANHIGVNILVFTSDWDLIVPKRSKKVVFRNSELVPSVSGALSVNDIGEEGMNNFSKLKIVREGKEELGILSDNFSQIELLAITREITRGGKPEIIMFATTPLSRNAIIEHWKSAEDKKENESLVFFNFYKSLHAIFSISNDNKADKRESCNAFNSEINKIYEEQSNNLSQPLLVCLALFQKHVIALSEKK